MLKVNVSALQFATLVKPYESIYAYFLYIMALLNTIFSLLMVYFYWRKLPKVDSGYRCFLSATVFQSWILHTTFALMGPVLLLPFFGGYSVGVLRWFGPQAFLIGMGIILSYVTLQALTFFMVFLLQSFHLQIFVSQRLGLIIEWFSKVKNVVIFNSLSAIAHIIFHFTLIYQVYRLQMTTEDYERMGMSQLRAEHPSLMLMETTNGLSFIVIFAASVLLVTLLLIFFAFCANFASYRAINATSKSVQLKTFEMQRAVQRILSAQLISALAFYYSPIIIISANIVLYHLKLYHGNFLILQISICLFSFHLPSQLLISILRFPQFRRMLSSWFWPSK